MDFTTRSIIEMMGYPEAHVKKVMETIVERLGKNENVEIVKQETSEPELVKEKMFSTFVELEIKFKNIQSLYLYCTEFLPTSIEILDTTEVKMKTIDFTSSLNEVIAYLHRYNLALHNAHSRIGQLEKQLGIEPKKK